MLVEWLPQALEEIAGYLAERNPYAADQIQAAIEATAETLPQYPYIHRPGRVPGTREAVVHPNYLVVYRVGTERISIESYTPARNAPSPAC